MLLFLIFQLWIKVAKPSSEKSHLKHAVKAIALAKIAKFFMIPIIIWSNNVTESPSLRLMLVNIYYFLSLVHVLSVLTECSRKCSAVMILLTITIKYIVMVEVTQRLDTFCDNFK